MALNYWSFFTAISRVAGALLAIVCVIFVGLCALELNGSLTWLSPYFGVGSLVPIVLFSVFALLGIGMMLAKSLRRGNAPSK